MIVAMTTRRPATTIITDRTVLFVGHDGPPPFCVRPPPCRLRIVSSYTILATTYSSSSRSSPFSACACRCLVYASNASTFLLSAPLNSAALRTHMSCHCAPRERSTSLAGSVAVRARSWEWRPACQIQALDTATGLAVLSETHTRGAAQWAPTRTELIQVLLVSFLRAKHVESSQALRSVTEPLERGRYVRLHCATRVLGSLLCATAPRGVGGEDSSLGKRRRARARPTWGGLCARRSSHGAAHCV